MSVHHTVFDYGNIQVSFAKSACGEEDILLLSVETSNNLFQYNQGICGAELLFGEL
jgi:hypothetical protein